MNINDIDKSIFEIYLKTQGFYSGLDYDSFVDSSVKSYEII